MQTYVFRYRRRFFWRKFVVAGHKLEESFDKMVIFFADGSLREIKNWKQCELCLGVDWVNASRKLMEQRTGTAIPLNTTS